MKELSIYFGKQNDSPLGWGTTADTVKCEISENFDMDLFFSKKWACIRTITGVKFINTDNILWVDVVDKTQIENESENKPKTENKNNWF